MSRPAVHLFLREADLRQDAANVLRNEIVDRFRLVIESRYRGHNHRAGLLRPHRSSLMPLAIAPSVPIEHGITTIASTA